MIIELLSESYGWERGYRVEVLDSDENYYYFYDEWDRWSCIKKTAVEEYRIIRVQFHAVPTGRNLSNVTPSSPRRLSTSIAPPSLYPPI